MPQHVMPRSRASALASFAVMTWTVLPMIVAVGAPLVSAVRPARSPMIAGSVSTPNTLRYTVSNVLPVTTRLPPTGGSAQYVAHRIRLATVLPDRTAPSHRLIFAVDWPIDCACFSDSDGSPDLTGAVCGIAVCMLQRLKQGAQQRLSRRHAPVTLPVLEPRGLVDRDSRRAHPRLGVPQRGQPRRHELWPRRTGADLVDGGPDPSQPPPRHAEHPPLKNHPS